MVLVENGSKGTWRGSGLVLGILRFHGEALDLTPESRGGFEKGAVVPSCFKEGVRQIPVESVPGIREQGVLAREGACCSGCG